MNRHSSFLSLLLVMGSFLSPTTFGQEVNYDESKIPAYKLPEILKFEDATEVTNAADWKRRRAKLVELFSKHVYGAMPGRKDSKWKVDKQFTIDRNDANSEDLKPGTITARCKEVLLSLRGNQPNLSVPVRILVVLPLDQSKPAPVFLAYNFGGNHTVHGSPKITCDLVWSRDPETKTRIKTEADPKKRGTRAGRWPIDLILQEGFGLVTLYYEDVDPDFDDIIAGKAQFSGGAREHHGRH